MGRTAFQYSLPWICRFLGSSVVIMIIAMMMPTIMMNTKMDDDKERDPQIPPLPPVDFSTDLNL